MIGGPVAVPPESPSSSAVVLYFLAGLLVTLVALVRLLQYLEERIEEREDDSD